MNNVVERRFGTPQKKEGRGEHLDKKFPKETRVQIRNKTHENLVTIGASLAQRKREFRSISKENRYGRVTMPLGTGALVELDSGTSAYFPYDELIAVKE